MSGFRGSNLTKIMASLQDLESFEPLNPLTPDPDFGNLFCVFRQAIGKFLFAIPFFRASYWEIQHRAGPQICSLLASYREIAHNAAMVLTPWFIAVNTIVYWGLPCRRRPSSNDFASRKSLLRSFCEHRWKTKGPKMGL